MFAFSSCQTDAPHDIAVLHQITNLGVKYTSKPVSFPFLATLVALEATIGIYWVGYIKLFKVCSLPLSSLISCIKP